MTRRNLQPLEELLVEISQRCFATRWYNGMEWWGWHFMLTGPQGAGRGQVTAQDVADMRQLSLDLDNGWMLYPLQQAAFMDHHRMVMAYGGGPNKVIEEVRRLERKLQNAMNDEDWARVDGYLQGTRRWW
jgi:hypothetical protein